MGVTEWEALAEDRVAWRAAVKSRTELDETKITQDAETTSPRRHQTSITITNGPHPHGYH